MGANFSLKSESNCDKELDEAKLINDSLFLDNRNLASDLQEAKSKSNCAKELLEVDSINRKLQSSLIEANLKLEAANKNDEKKDWSKASIGVNDANHNETLEWEREQIIKNAKIDKQRETENVTGGYAVYERKSDTLTIKKPNGDKPLEISGFKTSQTDNKDNLVIECEYPKDYPPNSFFKLMMGRTFICKGEDAFGLSQKSLNLATGESESDNTVYIKSITIKNPTMRDVATKKSISGITEVTIWLNRELGETEEQKIAIDKAVNSIKITRREDTEEYKKKQQKNRRGGKRIKRKTKRRRNSKGKSKRNTVRFNQ